MDWGDNMKFDICDVFNQDEYDEIRKFLLEKLNHIPEEATISDVSMELHKIVEEVLYEYEIDTMIWEVDLMRRSDLMLNVMFENSKGQSRTIGTVENEESAFKVINDFLDDHKYKSYYQRTWKKDDKTTVVDVGSHTEFFYIQEV